ncbi:MAG: hypothetical protein HOP33_20725 [Verrucomicrobia bacterium]|nr:hypothetical protein [Verrucomicrobiota bacterium]
MIEKTISIHTPNMNTDTYKPLGMIFSCCIQSVLLVSVVVLTGCSSPNAYVIARRDARFNLSNASKIALGEHSHPREAEETLKRDLLAALTERGIALVPPEQAEFTLTYWLDDSWKPGKKFEYEGNPSMMFPRPMVIPPPKGFGGSSTVIYQEPIITAPRVVDWPYYIQGIRLKVYPKTGDPALRLRSAWEGYIEGGDRVSKKRQPVLLRTLLDYYGQDFNGKAPAGK